MIRSTGVFLDTADFTAYFRVKYRDRMRDGILQLRDFPEDDDTAIDLPILKEWRTARALLGRFKASAAQFLNGQTATLGRAWIEMLPGNCGTPWSLDEDDYAQAHIRTRTCLIPTPGNITLSGAEQLVLGVGIVNVVEHRILNSEINLSPHPRVHLVIDVRRPESADG